MYERGSCIRRPGRFVRIGRSGGLWGSRCLRRTDIFIGEIGGRGRRAYVTSDQWCSGGRSRWGQSRVEVISRRGRDGGGGWSRHRSGR